MKDIATAVFLGIACLALAWTVRGCMATGNVSIEEIHAKAQVQVEQEKTKQIQYQWKMDSLKRIIP